MFSKSTWREHFYKVKFQLSHQSICWYPKDILWTKHEKVKFLNCKSLFTNLRQATHIRYQTLWRKLKDIEFETTNSDPCLFKNSEYIYIVVHVDDTLVMVCNESSTPAVQSQIESKFELSSFRKLNKFLGILVHRHTN